MSQAKYERPMDYAERVLVENILDGTYPIAERLPAERELAGQLGITRPTLREAIRKLEQEGWLLVQAGKPTMVRNFWQEGGLAVLSRIIHHQGYVKPGFITNLLQFRVILAPSYTRDAVENDTERVIELLQEMPDQDADPAVYAAFDWKLQRTLTLASGNVIYPLILNGFDSFYEKIALIYFDPYEARQASHVYYLNLMEAFTQNDGQRAMRLTESVMEVSVELWQSLSAGVERIPVEI